MSGAGLVGSYDAGTDNRYSRSTPSTASVWVATPGVAAWWQPIPPLVECPVDADPAATGTATIVIAVADRSTVRMRDLMASASAGPIRGREAPMAGRR